MKPERSLEKQEHDTDLYKHLGFEVMDQKQTMNGIRFTPMKYVEKIGL